MSGDPDVTAGLLGQAVEALMDAADMAAAEMQIDRIAAAIDMPRVAWSVDISQPFINPHADAFLRRQGWPDEVMELWWRRSVTTKMPFYIRCRFEHVPFITDVRATPGRGGPAGLGPDPRRVREIVLALGHTALLTVPIHLPRGQVSMLTWAGARDPVDLAAMLGRTAGHLLGAGHYFMRAFNRTVGLRGVTAEELVRLSPRERDCLRLCAQGYGDAEIATLAGIARTTVRYNIDNVVEKLGAVNRTHAVALAAQLGLIGPVSA
ncbi:MAG TPA: LuxR C-terminal-related transcriptional regulator [Vineibacter sp.]|nr:LuxR C-terminal-related transcriptional regulator [Vineibacter sp.]